MGAYDEKFKRLTRAQKNAMNFMAFSADHFFEVEPKWSTLQSLGKLGLLEFRYPDSWKMPTYVFTEWSAWVKKPTQQRKKQT